MTIVTTQQEQQIVPWNISHVIAMMALGMGILFVSSWTLEFLIGSFPLIERVFQLGEDRGTTMFIMYFLQVISFSIPIILIGKYLSVGKWPPVLAWFHLPKKHLWGSIILAQITNIFIILALRIAMWFGDFQHIPGYSGLQDPLSDTFGRGALSYFFAFIAVSVLAPLFEEVFFRSILQSTLLKYLPVPLGILGSSIVFALVHFESQVFFPLLLSGIVLGILFHKTRSIIPGILFHGISNGLYLLAEITL